MKFKKIEEDNTKASNSSVLLMVFLLLALGGIYLWYRSNVITVSLQIEGEEAQSISATKGEIVELPVLEKDGYDFLGWYDGEIRVDDAYVVTKSTILVPKWKEKTTYIVKFDPKEGDVTLTKELPCGNAISLPTGFEKGDYYLAYWANEKGDVVEDGEVLSCKNVTLTANWVLKEGKTTYTVTFNPNNGESTSTQDINCGNRISLPTNYTKDNHYIAYWKDSNGKVINDGEILKCYDTTLTAHWVNRGSSTTFNVTFDPDNGQTKITNKVSCGSGISLPTNYTKDNYYLSYWKDSNGNVVKNGAVLECKDTTLYAQWTRNSSSEDNNNNGNNNNNNSNNSNSKGIVDNGNTNSTKYTVTYDPNNGQSTVSTQFTCGAKADMPTGYKKEGYYLAYWTDDNGNTIYRENELPCRNVKITAYWIHNGVIEMRDITFITNNGTPNMGIPHSCNSNDKTTLNPPKNLTKEGYYLAYWTDSAGNRYTSGQEVDCKEMTLSAYWIANGVINSRNITFITNNDTPNMSVPHVCNSSGKTTLNPPSGLTKDGYYLAYWTDSAGNRYTGGEEVDCKQMTISAYWIHNGVINTANITYNPNNGDSTITSQQICSSNGKTTLNPPKNYTKDGYYLAYWKDGAGKTYAGDAELDCKATTLTAYWIANGIRH